MRSFKFTVISLFIVYSGLNTVFFSQQYPPVYMTLTSHNEDNSQWTSFSFYKSKRDLLVQLANTV